MGRVTALAACLGLGWAGMSLSRPLAAQDSSPRLFAPGVVSTDAPEFAAAFTPDGDEVYFNRASADRSTLTIMTSRRSAAGAWSPPVVASFSGTFRDVDPFVAADGRRLYFTSDRPRNPDGVRTFATWFVERTTSGWGPPIDPGAPLNSSAGDVFFTMARDGTAVFTSSRDGGSRVFASRLAGGRWTTPAPVAFGSSGEGGNPAIAPSGRFMVVVRAPAGGAADLFYSCREGSGWSAARALDAVNSPFADFAPNIDAGETTLTFTSERPGVVGAQPEGVRPPGDLYRISLVAAGIRCP